MTKPRALPCVLKMLRTKAALGAAPIGCVLSAMIFFAAPSVAQSQPAATETDAASTAVVEDALNIWEKRLVQEGLILLGYYKGFADGEFGKGTHDAIAAFQTGHDRPATGRVTAMDALNLGGSALALRKKLDWRPLDTSTGISMSYPAALLPNRKNSDEGGETLESDDDHVSLMTVRLTKIDPDGINAMFEKLADGSSGTVTYKLRRQNLFILSGDRQGGKFYTRMEQRGEDIRGYELTWTADANDLMQGVSVLISNGFYPFGDSGADGPPTYPFLLKLAQQAGPDTKQADAGKSTGNQTAQSDSGSSGENKGIIEQKPDALPPPKDSSLVTSDGKGLRFTYQYVPPDNPDLRYAYQWAADTHMFSTIPEIDGLDGLFVTPRPLRYVATQCGTVNAFYNKNLSAVVLCYEMIDSLTKMGAALAKGAHDPKALTVEFVKDNLRFILLHESGHAMIDLLDMPAVGREEDSVDQFSAVVLMTHTETSETENDIARVVQLAATWFKVNSADTPNNDKSIFADEHALDAQRYFNLLCFIYGRDPDHFRGIADGGMLPKARADRCPEEAAKITRSWSRLMLPHFAPRFKPHDEPSTGSSSGDTPASQSQGNNPFEWDGKSNPFDH